MTNENQNETKKTTKQTNQIQTKKQTKPEDIDLFGFFKRRWLRGKY